MRSTRTLAFSCLALLALVALSGQAFAASVAVGSCTSLVNFATIQQAVTASPAGTIIKICPGTYREQVEITTALTLQGLQYVSQDAVVIAPPAGGLVANTVDLDNASLPVAAQIWVHDTAGPVVIANLTVDGAGNAISGCSPDPQGILFQNASGTVNHVAVRNEVSGDVLNGCQSGEGIYVQTSAGLTSTVTVQNSSVHNYNKNGITGNDAGTTLNVMGSYVQGSGALGLGFAAQNGVQIAYGAAGKVSTSTITDNSYTGPTYGASNILLFDTANGITVNGNTVGNSQIPVGLYTDTAGVGDGVTVASNKIFGTLTWDAIDVCTNNNSITMNTIINSAESAIHLDASCGSTGTGNSVTKNTIVESACAGVLDDTGGTGGNTLAPNTYFTVPFTLTSSTSRCTLPVAPKAKLTFSPVR